MNRVPLCLNFVELAPVKSFLTFEQINFLITVYTSFVICVFCIYISTLLVLIMFRKHFLFQINTFYATGLFLYPRKHQKTCGFLFSESIGKDQWHDMV